MQLKDFNYRFNFFNRSKTSDFMIYIFCMFYVSSGLVMYDTIYIQVHSLYIHFGELSLEMDVDSSLSAI